MDNKYIGEETINVFNEEAFKRGDAYRITWNPEHIGPITYTGILTEVGSRKLSFAYFDGCHRETLDILIQKANQYEIIPMRAGETGFTDPEANLIYTALVKLERSILKGKGHYDGYFDTFNSIYKKLKENNNIVEEPDDGD